MLFRSYRDDIQVYAKWKEKPKETETEKETKTEEKDENRKKILQKELSVLNTEEKIANGLLQFEVSENVRLSVMDKIQNYYAPKLKAYYATL